MEVTLQSFKKRFTYDPAKDLLGKGGFAEVYKAYDNEDHHYVALKISQGTTDDKYNLVNEVKRFKKLNHPNIVKHIEAYEVTTGTTDIHGKPLYYHVGILEYADSGTIADLLKKGYTNYRIIEDVAKDVIEGLAYLHANGIIHRDLKPSNILLFKEGEKLRAKITDFGIAKNTDATAASTQLVGTVEYMAPEYFTTGHITPASDMWSLGVMLLEALTGTHPFGKTTQGISNEQIIANILNKDTTGATQNLTEPFKGIITRCLFRDANLRPQSANELKGLLQQTGDAFSEKTQVIVTKYHGNSGRKKSLKNIKYIGFFLLIVCLAGLVLFVANKNVPHKPTLLPTYSLTGYYGFKDSATGKMAIPLVYDYADSFHDGLALVLINEKFGFINTEGDTVIPAIYEYALSFSDGLALIYQKQQDGNFKYGYVNTEGKLAINSQYDAAESFN